MSKLDKYYKILGLPPESAFFEVRKAYQDLSVKYSADLNRSDSGVQEKYERAREAYFQIRDSIFQMGPEFNNVKTKDKNIFQRYLFPEEEVDRISLKDDEPDLNILFEKYYEDIGRESGFEFLPFISLKGGTGKSSVVNNLAVILSLVTRYIEKHLNKAAQRIELYDLDFSKPDQRFLLGVNPKFFFDDIMGKNSNINDLKKIRVNTPLHNLSLLSIDPHRGSSRLFYQHKFKLMYILNESDADIKLIDFGAGLSNEILFFLRNINQKVIVANPEKSSIEAIFKIIVTLITNHINRAFNDDPKIKKFTEKLKRCRSLNYNLKNLKEDIENLDSQRILPENISHFYQSELVPVKQKLGLNADSLSEYTPESLQEEIQIIEKEFEVRFAEIKNEKKNNGDPEELKADYSRFLRIRRNSDKYSNHTERISQVLSKHKIGILMNKADEQVATEINDNLRYHIKKLLGFNVSNLGYINEYSMMRNISNLKMPFVLLDPTSSPAIEFYRISDRMLNLQPDTTFKAISQQLDYITFIRKNWRKN